MNFEKLKETARKYEQKEEWRRAIEVYLQAIREFEAGNDPVPDLSVYNRIGDLYLKANEPGAAVQAYERAADLYGEQGFYNNAIALCGKILRVNPGRIQTYLKLAQLHARKNVVIEAKKNLLEYLERMNTLGQLDDAFKSVKDFADQFPANKEIRLMLSELLRASSRNAEAREQLEKLASDLEARGDTIGARKTLMRLQAIESEDGAPVSEALKPSTTGPRPRSADLVFLDIGASSISATPPKPAGPPSRKTRAVVVPPGGRATTQNRPPSGLPLIDVGEDPAAAAPEPEPLAIETSSLVQAPIELHSMQKISDEAVLEASASGEIAKALGFEPTEVDGLDQVEVQPVDGLQVDRAGPEGVELNVSLDGLDLERSSEPDLVPDPVQPVHTDNFLTPDPLDMQSELSDEVSIGLGQGLIEVPPTESGLAISGMDMLDASMDEADIDPAVDDDAVTFLDAPDPELPSIEELEDRVLDDPDDPEAHRILGEALLATGETLRGQEELELALAGYEGREDWGRASDLIQELIRLDPNGVRYHQKLVEIAFRSGDRARLIDAYLELADALLRVGALDKALAVYRRVSEHDPGNRRALAALDALSPAEDEYPIPPPPQAAAEPVVEELDQALDAAFDAPPPPPARGSRKSVPVPRAPEPEPVDLGDFIDLGALVMEDDRVKDTRMRVEDEEPTGDEAKDFQEMLQAFKRGIDENIEAEDYQAHYDLGVAFKEMGLLDEAISEFQKALRAPEGRLKTSEALGTAFYEKGQYAIAEAILKRAVESLGATDDEQIGLIYWLARSLEAQGKSEPAITAYERVMAVEIRFMDASARMTRLSGGRGR